MLQFHSKEALKAALEHQYIELFGSCGSNEFDSEEDVGEKNGALEAMKKVEEEKEEKVVEEELEGDEDKDRDKEEGHEEELEVEEDNEEEEEELDRGGDEYEEELLTLSCPLFKNLILA